MRVRPATVADLPDLVRLSREARVEGWTASEWAGVLEDPLMHVRTAPSPDGMRGFVLFRIVADEAELVLIAVRTGRRRQGIGEALWSDFVASARGSGVGPVHLEVAADNVAALGFYASVGFEEVGRRPRYYRDGRDAVLMRLDLEQNDPQLRPKPDVSAGTRP